MLRRTIRSRWVLCVHVATQHRLQHHRPRGIVGAMARREDPPDQHFLWWAGASDRDESEYHFVGDRAVHRDDLDLYNWQPPEKSADRYVALDEAAWWAGVSIGQIKSWIGKDLAALEVGGKRRIQVASLFELGKREELARRKRERAHSLSEST